MEHGQRVALVTGGARGIGRAVAARLAAEITGAAKKPLYQLALTLGGDAGTDAE